MAKYWEDGHFPEDSLTDQEYYDFGQYAEYRQYKVQRDDLKFQKHMSRVLESTSDNFVTQTGIAIRRKTYKVGAKGLAMLTPGQILVENDFYPELEKDTPYIFVCTHSFKEDFQATLSHLDRNAFLLIGSTDQIKYNPQAFFPWLNGMVYVNKLDKESKGDSLKKQARILLSGTSILMFPEGKYNNLENADCERLYPGFYKLFKMTNAKIVPIAVLMSPDNNKHLLFENPISFEGFTQREAVAKLRDILASMYNSLALKYNGELKREDLPYDYRKDFMVKRANEYLRQDRFDPDWEEELTGVYDKTITDPQVVRASLDHIKLDASNIKTVGKIILPELIKREEDIRYDLRRYLEDVWHAKIVSENSSKQDKKLKRTR